MHMFKKAVEKTVAPGTRGLHRSYENRLLELAAAANKGTNPQRFFPIQAPKALANCPALIERTLVTTVAMTERNLIPLITTMPSSSEMPLRFNKEQAPSAFKEGSEPHEILRAPFGSFMLSAEDAMKQIPAPNSSDKSPKHWLISTSPAIFAGGRNPLESPGEWLDQHMGGRSNYLILHACEEIMQRYGFDQYPGYRDTIHRVMWNIIRQYGRLQIGKLMVIGVPPELLAKIAYDSVGYNIPTGLDVMDVLRHPKKYPQRLSDDLIITLVCCAELLDPSSGIIIIDCGKPKIVKEFCRGMSFEPLRNIKVLREALGEPTDPTFERRQETCRKRIDQELADFMKVLIQYKDSPAALIEAFSNVEVYPVERVDWPEPNL